jgi:adenine phosphoribosyltransferase
MNIEALRWAHIKQEKIIECCFIIDLPDIGGRARLEKHGHKVFALCEFEGD